MGPSTGVESGRKSPTPTPSPPSGYGDKPALCPSGCQGQYSTGSVLQEMQCYKTVPGDTEVAAGHGHVQGKSWGWGSHPGPQTRFVLLDKLGVLARQNPLRSPAMSLQRPLLTELVIVPAGKGKMQAFSFFPGQAMKGESGTEKQYICHGHTMTPRCTRSEIFVPLSELKRLCRCSVPSWRQNQRICCYLGSLSEEA